MLAGLFLGPASELVALRLARSHLLVIVFALSSHDLSEAIDDLDRRLPINRAVGRDEDSEVAEAELHHLCNLALEGLRNIVQG